MVESSDPRPGHLYLVGTPIGNLEDMTLRAVRILKNVDLIAAEDTRHTGKLLQHFQITTPQISYHTHNRQSRLPEILDRLYHHKSIALVTDAGMPGISDPGYELVQACRANQLPVVPIPGPTAGIAALCCSGLATDRFVFEGFLPNKESLRQKRLASLSTEERTIVLYEAPHKLLKTLQDLQETLGSERQITIAREITKRYEEFWQGSIASASKYFQESAPRGEFTLVVEGIRNLDEPPSEAVIKQELARLLTQGLSRSSASRQVALLLGCSKNLVYQLALTLEPAEKRAEE